MSPYSVSRWKKQYGGRAGQGAPMLAFASSAPGVSVAELERRIRASLERENADLREQRTILKKAVAIFSEPPR